MTADFPDVLADADFLRDWQRDHSLDDPPTDATPRLAPSRVRFPLAPLGTCFVCGRREEDQLVDFEGAVRGICSTCWERGQDELPRGDADDEC